MTAETHPSLESLAAFADGRLAEGDRRPVVEHLAGCEECYELVAETLQVQEELEEEGEDPVEGKSQGQQSTQEEDPAERSRTVAPFSREPESEERRGLRSRLPGARFFFVAATIALASLAGVWIWNALQPRGLAYQVAALELPPAWSSYEFNADFRAVLTEEEIADAVRAGARFLDLQTALVRQDAEAAANAVSWLQTSAGGRGGERFLADDTYEAVAAALAQEDFKSAKEVLRQRTPIQDQMLENRGVEPYFALGVWAEAGRLAALAGDLDLLSSERFREQRPAEVPGRLPGQRYEKLREQLTALEEPLTGADLPEVAKRFEEILNLSPVEAEAQP